MSDPSYGRERRKVIQGIEEEFIGYPPARRCTRCPTKLRYSNPGPLCSLCERQEQRLYLMSGPSKLPPLARANRSGLSL